jgi:hypothetical protein
MTRTELIIQLLKVAIGLAFGAYFVWWSLEVLDRLTPEYDAPTAVVGRASWGSPPRRSGRRGYGHSAGHGQPINAWLAALFGARRGEWKKAPGVPGL